MSVELQGFKELNARFKQLADQVATQRERQSIAASGASPIAREAVKLAPKSTKEHFYYQNGAKISINPGNLKLSIRMYKQFNGDVSIGPRRLKKITGEIGTDAKTASGYYAAALYKSSSNFRRQVTEKAAQAKINRSLKLMDNAVARILKKYQ